ncbi:hypothetical protein [Xanthobacter agilis]|uniref:Uncharacterized protein n=1 Tax=Xanthobacter agilis TaxID=47492 RepID=A0ABU0LE69_XANAG|nr:hypothetical protein [Xanthobacter agilis]MDQ0505432.1 hypothetical protein [Xanthobacter agilis]
MTMISTRQITARQAAPALAGAAFSLLAAVASASIGRAALLSAVLAATLALGTTPSQAVELDAFLEGVDECALPRPASPLGVFVHSLVQRYANKPGNPRGYAADRTDISLDLPPDIADAFGSPTPSNFGEYTQVTVPLNGTFGGLPVTQMTFRFGNKNGIKAFMIVFNASRADVVSEFGEAVESGDDRGQNAGRRGDGYSAEIPYGEPGRIACDWSS